MCCEARKREERRRLRDFLEFASGWYGDWLLRACCLAETLLADCSFSPSAAFQHASGLRILGNGAPRSEIRSLGGLVAVRFDAISFSESGGFPLFLLGFAACCLWNRVGRSRDSGDLSSLPRFLHLNKSVLGLSYVLSHVSKSSFDEIALECFLLRVGVRGWSEAGKNARAINGVMSFCWFSVAALCFISVICVTFSMSEKHFSQSMGGGPEWKGCWKFVVWCVFWVFFLPFWGSLVEKGGDGLGGVEGNGVNMMCGLAFHVGGFQAVLRSRF